MRCCSAASCSSACACIKGTAGEAHEALCLLAQKLFGGSPKRSFTRSPKMQHIKQCSMHLLLLRQRQPLRQALQAVQGHAVLLLHRRQLATNCGRGSSRQRDSA